MFKIAYIFLITMIIVFSGCSSKKQVNPEPNDEVSYKQQQIKDAAYAEAIKKIKDELEKKVEKKYERILKKYEEHFYRLELGKLAIKKGYVSNPEIITYRSDNGKISVDSLGCKIQRPLKIKEIIELYSSEISKIKNNINPSTKSNQNINQLDQDIEGIDIENINYSKSNIQVKDSPIDQNQFLKLEKTYKTKEILDDYLANYSLQDDLYIVRFNTFADKKSFCEQTNICKKGN